MIAIIANNMQQAVNHFHSDSIDYIKNNERLIRLKSNQEVKVISSPEDALKCEFTAYWIALGYQDELISTVLGRIR